MRRRFALLCLLLTCSAALAAGPEARLELNTASQAQLERLKGVGVALSERLLRSREQAPFADWQDLRRRVPGLGGRLAQRLSDQGLTVNGAALGGGAEAEAAASAAR